MPPQCRNQFWQSLEEGAGKRCSECAVLRVGVQAGLFTGRTLESIVTKTKSYDVPQQQAMDEVAEIWVLGSVM